LNSHEECNHALCVVMRRSIFNFCILLACAEGLRLAASIPTSKQTICSSSPSRRAFLSGIGIVSATAVMLQPAAVEAAASKGYMTLEEYNKLKAQEKKDEKLYGQFEALKDRAAQTSEYDRLAGNDDYPGIAKLSRAWDSTIRKESIESIINELDAADRERGAALNKQILSDLKQLDKLAKNGDKDAVYVISAQLRQHVLDFAKLAPARLGEKFGVDDL